MNVVELGDLKEKVRAAIAALPDHERVVVRLFYLQEQSVKEVAWRLQLPETTVKKRLQYAREHMRENIIEMHGVSLMACQMQSVNVDGSLIILMLALLQRSYVSFRR